MNPTHVDQEPEKTKVNFDPAVQSALGAEQTSSLSRGIKISEFALLDGALIWLAGIAGILPRLTHMRVMGHVMTPASLNHVTGLLITFSTVMVLAFQSTHLYNSDTAVGYQDRSASVFRCILFSAFLLVLITWLTQPDLKWWAVETSVVSGTALLGWRRSRYLVLRRRLAHGVGFRHALLIGAGQLGRTFAEYVSAHPELGLRVSGCLDDEEVGDDVLGPLADLDRVLHEQFIDEVFISSRVDAETFGRIASLTYRKRIDCKVISEVHPGTNPRQATKFVGNFAVLELYAEPITSSGSLLKRLIDIFGSAAAIIATSPIFLLIAIAIRLEGRGPVIYSAVRVGKKGKTFTCLKFRTMIPNADDLKLDLAHLNERDGALFKITNDPRITRVGKFLRKISLDELPQFLNVLAGDMSMVGPRPPDLFDYNRYDYRHLRRLDVTPGITGLWQVTSRKDPSFDTMMHLDLRYIENWSLYMDFKIMVLTLPALVRGS